MTNIEDLVQLTVLEAELNTAQAALDHEFAKEAEILRTTAGLNRSDAANYVMQALKAETTDDMVVEFIDLAATAYLNS